MGCLGTKIQFLPAVCPLCYLLLNHWTKFNKIWCVSYSYECGMQRHFFLDQIPLGPWGGSKGQILFNLNYKVNFKHFYYQTLCVYSQMKDTKHIRRDFHSVAWVMPQGWDFGVLGVPSWYLFFKHGHVAYQIDEDDEQNIMQVKFLS